MVVRNNRRVNIDRHSPEPIWRQLADIIRGRIETGRYAPGSTIPSLQSIHQETEVAVETIKKAIRLLAVEGYVLRVPGKGTYVNPREMWPGE